MMDSRSLTTLGGEKLAAKLNNSWVRFKLGMVKSLVTCLLDLAMKGNSQRKRIQSMKRSAYHSSTLTIGSLVLQASRPFSRANRVNILADRKNLFSISRKARDISPKRCCICGWNAREYRVPNTSVLPSKEPIRWE